MENKLGAILGQRRHSLSITNDNKQKTSITITIDFTSASDNDIASWLCSNRVISGQRVWRAMSLNELNELDNQTFPANTIGQKVKTRAERVNALVAIGLPNDLAEIAVDNPASFKQMMASVDNDELEPTE